LGVHLDEIRQNIKENLLDQIIDGLTKPLGSPEQTGKKEAVREAGIAHEGTLEEINQFFIEKEWSDGLPIIPPTPERVETFLKFTDQNPDETIAVLPQANLAATPRNIAANAIMAGCRPEHLPLLIAAAEALGEDHYNLNNIGTTWGVYPYLLVNGPIVKQLNIACKGQLICKGPNPALGRALGLMVRNIGGYRPGRNYMGTFGYPLVFAIAENEDENPWEPFHVEHGFTKNTSTITAAATINWGWSPSPYSTADRSAAQVTLEMLSSEVVKKASLGRLAEIGPKGMRNMITFLLSPPVAKSLGDAGYSKQDIREYVYENARVPLRELDWNSRYTHPDLLSVNEKIEMGIYPEDYRVDPDELIRVLPSPDILHIVVCGDPSRNRLMVLWTGYIQPVTKEVKLPSNWDQIL
jgi:hypothetical protein